MKNYRLSDNNLSSTFETFETNSYFEVMAKLEQRVKGSNIVFVVLDRTTNLEKKYRWDNQNNCIYNY
tara:strand:+ start:283 stop:483 length:201 start_codon:yes stop_codon:yes gene_type:complete